MTDIVRPPRQLEDDQRVSIFLAGGITGWREPMIEQLRGFPGVIFDPRISNWPTDLQGKRSQIEWETKYLMKATVRTFWFAAASSCRISLFELAMALTSDRSCAVGADRNYPRRDELTERCRLIQPAFQLVDSLDDLAAVTKRIIQKTHDPGAVS